MFKPHHWVPGYFPYLAIYSLHAHTCTCIHVNKVLHEAVCHSQTELGTGGGETPGVLTVVEWFSPQLSVDPLHGVHFGVILLHLPDCICLWWLANLLGVASSWGPHTENYLIKPVEQEWNTHFKRAWKKKGEILGINLSRSLSALFSSWYVGQAQLWLVSWERRVGLTGRGYSKECGNELAASCLMRRKPSWKWARMWRSWQVNTVRAELYTIPLSRSIVCKIESLRLCEYYI